MNPIRVGSYVTHSMRPGWGVGKVFGQSAQHVLVGFSGLPEAERFKRLEWRVGLLEKADVRSDPELDSWKVECDSTCHYLGATPKAKRVAKPKEAKVDAGVTAAPDSANVTKAAKAADKESKVAAKETKTAVKPVKAGPPAKAVPAIKAKARAGQASKAAKPAAKKPAKAVKAKKKR